MIHVQSGGFWQINQDRGHVRVIVTRECGPEHCYEHSVVEWIAESGSRVAPRIHAKAWVELPIDMHVARVEFWPTGQWIGFIEVETRAGENRMSWCVDVRRIGAATTAEGACEVGSDL